MMKLVREMLERFPNLTRFYRMTRDYIDQGQPLRDTPWGFAFAGHDGMAAGHFEPEETKLVRQLLGEADVLVNIGANVGYYCCHSLSVGKPVIAFEPNFRNLHYLLKNIRCNGWSRDAEIYPVALGRNADILQMWGGGTGASLVKGWASIPESYVTYVPVLNLDHVLGANLSGRNALILVDIEGAEFAMLQGAERVLRSDPRPVWLIEISSTEHQPSGVGMNPHFLNTFELFFNLGYRAFTADDARMEITLPMAQEILTGRRTLNTHNFLFHTPESLQ